MTEGPTYLGPSFDVGYLLTIPYCFTALHCNPAGRCVIAFVYKMKYYFLCQEEITQMNNEVDLNWNGNTVGMCLKYVDKYLLWYSPRNKNLTC